MKPGIGDQPGNKYRQHLPPNTELPWSLWHCQGQCQHQGALGSPRLSEKVSPEPLDTASCPVYVPLALNESLET